MVQWIRHHASTAGGTSLIPGGGTKIAHAALHGKKKKKRKVKKKSHAREQFTLDWGLLLKDYRKQSLEASK